MIVSLFRTLILYIFVTIGVRIMGKRQIGDLQPNELVVTILVSEIAAIPIQDVDQPVANGMVAIFLLIILELLLSIISMKWGKARAVIDGRPVIVVNNGVVDQKAMRRIRLTVDDLLEALRQKNVFELDVVQYAIIETNGKLSVLLKPEHLPATAEQVNAKPTDIGLSVPVICDGRIQSKFMQVSGINMPQVEDALKSRRLDIKDIFIMTVDRTGKAIVVKKE